MKKIILLLIFALSGILKGSAQGIDSTQMYVKNVTLQARYIAVLSPLINSGQELYDTLNYIIRTKPKPATMTTSVVIDSVKVAVIIDICRWLIRSDYGSVNTFYTPIVNVFKAIPNTYLQSQISDMDNRYIDRRNEIISEGLRRFGWK